ncbi:hypothetical protein PHSY_004597 [Pseudozyma hubeiensis SY62]|uniref:Uncharacterized protein n=1 Tax=Pseudozyma hubeiensis (strain SY62) TaxID=1305764 RepID=R9P6H5_PSEHS|nr:hypothetical protein PHSY_004597 [Pseudozyma hubeiensis SY62]GAC97013.1 hypothetical protein PHSY_004597 [Pseudozyma hubeiensis SY62]
MDWKEAADFSHRLNVLESSRHAGTSGDDNLLSRPMAPSGEVQATETSTEPRPKRSRFTVPNTGRISRPTIEQLDQRSPTQHQPQPAFVALAAADVHSASQPGSLDEFGRAISGDDIESKLRHFTEESFRASGLSLATLPTKLLIPDVYTWSPSKRLAEEMKTFVVGIDERLLDDMVALSLDWTDRYAMMNSLTQFRARTKVVAVQLPSDVVFVKFFSKHKLDDSNPLHLTMTLWTFHLSGTEGSKSSLVLRGISGVSSRIELLMKNSADVADYTVQVGQEGRHGYTNYLKQDYRPFETHRQRQ